MSDQHKTPDVAEIADERESSEQHCSTYRFATLQQLVDEVPSNRIMDCLIELGKLLQSAKGMAELTYMVAENIAAKEGRTLPPLPKQIFILPEFIEWIDDGKGDIEARMQTLDGVSLGTLHISPNDQGQPMQATPGAIPFRCDEPEAEDRK